MSVFFVHDSSMVTNTEGTNTSKIFQNCRVENTKLGENTTIGDYSRVFNCELGDNVSIQRYSMMYTTKMGKYSYTGKNFTSWYCEIGAFCSISWNVSIGGANHDYERTTTHSFLYSNDYKFIEENRPFYNRFADSCKIGNDVWIASNAIICRGVSIGNGAVVAAGAVVTHDVEPYTIVAGVPAKPLKKRFNEDIVDLLMKSQWWNFPDAVIKSNIDLFAAKTDYTIAEKNFNLRLELDKNKKIL